MGAFLLAAGAKGKRLALPNAEIMIHQPSAGTQGQITDMAIHLKRLEVVKSRMNRILAENTGKPIEVVTADCERDNFMTAQEAMEYGLIDKVIDCLLYTSIYDQEGRLLGVVREEDGVGYFFRPEQLS